MEPTKSATLVPSTQSTTSQAATLQPKSRTEEIWDAFFTGLGKKAIDEVAQELKLPKVELVTPKLDNEKQSKIDAYREKAISRLLPQTQLYRMILLSQLDPDPSKLKMLESQIRGLEKIMTAFDRALFNSLSRSSISKIRSYMELATLGNNEIPIEHAKTIVNAADKTIQLMAKFMMQQTIQQDAMELKKIAPEYEQKLIIDEENIQEITQYKELAELVLGASCEVKKEIREYLEKDTVCFDNLLTGQVFSFVEATAHKEKFKAALLEIVTESASNSSVKDIISAKK